METLAPVSLGIESMRRVEREGGCIVWGGSISLSPADDILISVERPLDVDSPAQLVASVLSKKGAAGATDVVIDMPVGPTAKVRTRDEAAELSALLAKVGDAIGLHVRTVITDGLQPVGRGMGPALEARDVVSVLRVEAAAPQDLRERAVLLAGHLLELGGQAAAGHGAALAEATLDSGAAWRKFQAICEAQGGLREPPVSSHRHVVLAQRAGRVSDIHNRRIARVAKLAGAPRSPAAGIELHVRLGTKVDAASPLFTIHAENPGELEYALDYAAARQSIITVDDTGSST
jgi:thymidine phosphorylase